MKNGQIAIEFLLLVAMSIVLLLVMLVVLNSISSTKIDEKTYFELNDLGKSIQKELLLASEVENGYTRYLNIPTTVNGRDFNFTTGNASEYSSYLEIEFEEVIIYYLLPYVNGTFIKGDNRIQKLNDAIFIN